MAKNKKLEKNFFFVGVSLKLYWFLLLARIFDWHLYVFDNFGGGNLQYKMLQKIQKRKWATRITNIHYPQHSSHTHALTSVDKIFDYIKNSKVIYLARKLYNSKETDLVFKKTLVKQLSLLTSVNKYIANKEDVKNPVLFISGEFRGIIKLCPELFDSSIKVKNGFYYGGLKLKVKWLVIVLGYILHLFVQQIYRKKLSKKKFRYGISISSQWAVKFRGPREFTFLVDDNIIKKNETIFLVEHPEIKIYEKYSSATNLTEAQFQRFRLFDRSTLKLYNDYSQF